MQMLIEGDEVFHLPVEDLVHGREAVLDLGSVHLRVVGPGRGDGEQYCDDAGESAEHGCSPSGWGNRPGDSTRTRAARSAVVVDEGGDPGAERLGQGLRREDPVWRPLAVDDAVPQ